MRGVETILQGSQRNFTSPRVPNVADKTSTTWQGFFFWQNWSREPVKFEFLEKVKFFNEQVFL